MDAPGRSDRFLGDAVALAQGCCCHATIADGEVKAYFAVHRETPHLAQVRAVGASQELGAWRPHHGVELSSETGLYPLWTRAARWICDSFSEYAVEFKFVTITREGEVIWEEGPNRLLQVSAGLDRRDTLPDIGAVPLSAPEVSEGLHRQDTKSDIGPIPVSSSEACSTTADDASPCSARGPHELDGSASEPAAPGVSFVIEATCNATGLGDELAVVGAAPALGAWDVAGALRLATSADMFPVWRGIVSFAANDGEAKLDAVEWKLVIIRSSGQCDWEPGANRRTALPRPEGSEADQALLARASFGGPPEEVVHVGGGRGAGANAPPPKKAPVPRGLAQQSLVFHARATAEVEVVFEGQAVRHHPKYMPSDDIWTLCLADAGLPQGLHAFYALVDGVRVLSEFHPAVGEDPGTRQSFVLVDEELWGYAQGFREAHRRQVKRRPAAAGSLLGEVASRGGSSPRKSGGMLRPSSTSSTASTCSTTSEKDDDQERAPKPFSSEVFAGLYDGDLPSRLGFFGTPPSGLSQVLEGRPLQLWTAGAKLHKPCGKCEDAYFANASAIGVADGVGSMVQFARYGTDAAAYAQELMALASEALEPNGPASAECMPAEVAATRAKAALVAAERGATSFGASTCAALVLEGENVGVANLGDSGFMVLRRGSGGMEIVHRSMEKQHHWNCPYQLCRLPPALLRRLQKDTRFDSAADSDCYDVRVQAGDLLIMYTDGLADNLYERDIRQIIDRALPPTFGALAGLPEMGTPPGVVADALARAAQERSLDPRAATPFAEASKAQGMECPGGKPDDITVVAAWVVPEAL